MTNRTRRSYAALPTDVINIIENALRTESAQGIAPDPQARIEERTTTFDAGRSNVAMVASSSGARTSSQRSDEGPAEPGDGVR